MSQRLKLVLLIHMIVSLILGVLLFVIPGRMLESLGWAPIDPIISRILGAALLAMSWGDLRLWRGGAQPAAKLWAEVHLGFSGLGAIGVLRHLVTGRWPVMPWLVFGVLGVFAVVWLWVLVTEPS
jgi:hypothetical protein